jgi:hypothetical protein
MNKVESIKRDEELSVDATCAAQTPYIHPFEKDTLCTKAISPPLLIEAAPPTSAIDFDQSRMTSTVKFFELREAGKLLVMEFVNDVAKSAQRFSNKNFLLQQEENQKQELFGEKKSMWNTIATTISGLLGVASMCIGASLIATGGAVFPIIAGAALIIAGLASIAATIMEKVGVKNECTLGVQIFGGVVGLASGGISIATSADKMALVIKIGTALLSAARYSSETISKVYQQKGFMRKAQSTIFESETECGNDLLKLAADMSKEINNQSLQSDMEFIQVIKRLIKANEAGNRDRQG